jgi:hypothetical protein
MLGMSFTTLIFAPDGIGPASASFPMILATTLISSYGPQGSAYTTRSADEVLIERPSAFATSAPAVGSTQATIPTLPRA